MPLNSEGVRAGLKGLAQVRLGDKVRFGLSHGKPTFGIDRKGLFQGFGRHAADSITKGANQKAIANILMAGAEEVSCGRIPPQELQQALGGLANLTGSYQDGKEGSGKQQRHETAGSLHRLLTTMVDNARMHGVPCLALVPGRTEDLEFTNRTNHPAPFDTWFEDVRQRLESNVIRGDNDWKEYDSSADNKYREPDGTGTIVYPILGDHRINPQGSGYPKQVFTDYMKLTVGVGLAGRGGRLVGEQATLTKLRLQPVPAEMIRVLNLATQNSGGQPDRALVYAALLMAHQGVMPGAMIGISRNLTLLSSGVAIGPIQPGNVHAPKEEGTSLHITFITPFSLTVTYIVELSEQKGTIYLMDNGAMQPVTKWTARVAIEGKLTRETPETIRFRLRKIQFTLRVPEVQA
jgi:hypothetical protein